MNKLLLQPSFLIAAVFIMAIIGGGVYVSVQLHNDESDKDALVKKAELLSTGHASAEQIAAELAKARADARTELERLNLFTNYPNSPEALAAVRQEVFDNISADVFTKIDKVVAEISKSPTQSEAKQQIVNQITTLQNHIKEVLAEWQKLVNDPVANSSPTAAQQSSGYANEIKKDIESLKDLSQQLTPENSGMSPSQIVQEQNTIDTVIDNANEAVSDLLQTSVPPSVVADQQNNVSNAQDTVNNLTDQLSQVSNPPASNDSSQSSGSNQSSGNDSGSNSNGSTNNDSGSSQSSGSTQSQGNATVNTSPNTSDPNYQPPTSPNYPGTRYVPPAPYVDPDSPKLIEGANPGQ